MIGFTQSTVIPTGVYPAVIQAVNGVDANLEGSPEGITYDVDMIVDQQVIKLEGIENSHRRHDNTIDGVAVTVKAFEPGVFCVVIVIGSRSQLAVLEHIKLRACPEA